MKYLYCMAGMKILCEIPFALTIDDSTEEFVLPLSEKEEIEADLFVKYCMTDAFVDFEKENCYDIACCHFGQNASERKIYYCAALGEDPYACVSWDCNHPKRMYLHYLAGAEKYLDYGRNIPGHLGIENLLWLNQGMLLHASFISCSGKGILFSGPSGIGKSTQAKLWETYENAEIINGDRAAIRYAGGSWLAYGSPCAGSSGIYKNKSAPIRAIVLLRQSDTNRIRKMSPAEAFVLLYPEVTIHGWDRKFVEDISGCLEKLLADVPVYMLECRPDEEAVSLVRNVI